MDWVYIVEYTAPAAESLVSAETSSIHFAPYFSESSENVGTKITTIFLMNRNVYFSYE